MLWWMSDVIELQVAYQQILTDKPLAGESGGFAREGGATQALSIVRAAVTAALSQVGKQNE